MGNKNCLEGIPNKCSAYYNGYCMESRIKYYKFQPCKHKGCLSHVSHPCEDCGRVGGDGIVYEKRCDFCFTIKG